MSKLTQDPKDLLEAINASTVTEAKSLVIKGAQGSAVFELDSKNRLSVTVRDGGDVAVHTISPADVNKLLSYLQSR